MSSKSSFIFIVFFVVIFGILFFMRNNQFDLPSGDAVLERGITSESKRQIFTTDGVRHSIPLDEILSGGPPKDGIPSIDAPQFISPKEADAYLTDESPGLGVRYGGEARFYPYQILVWHEIVNDTIAGDPLLVTYCPLCATGIVFDRTLNGAPVAFGVSGKLWQSNLLMYNRSEDPDQESLWSQVLGEAVVGVFTGEKLSVVLSDTVRYGEWKREHPDTVVLSRNTGTVRSYGRDPYEGYYTDESVGFGATFTDDRLHPKEFVLGIEYNGMFKAYSAESLPEGTTTDLFAGETVVIEKSRIGEVRFFTCPELCRGVGKDPSTPLGTGPSTMLGTGKTSLPYIGGFWFSWLAVHPDTELYK